MRIMLALSLLTGWAGGEDDRLPFSHQDRNFKLTYPFSWEEVPVPAGSQVQLALKKGTSIIVVSAVEMRLALEEFQSLVERDIRGRPGFDKVVSRDDRKIAGEEAIYSKVRIRERGRAFHLFSATFVHQGIAYRFYGTPAGGDEKAFLRDFESVLKSVSFLRDRRDWLARYNGVRQPTALWGGLATFALNRPRWQESALGDPQYPLYQEDLQFRFWAGGSLLYARIRETSATEARELRGVQGEMAAWMKGVKVKQEIYKANGKTYPYTVVTGEFKGFDYVIRIAVRVVNGVAVHAWLEGPRSQLAATQSDWNTLLETLTVQDKSKLSSPLAFPWRTAVSNGGQPDNTAAAVYLAKARRVSSSGRLGRYLTISPDGKKAILQQKGSFLLMDLATRQQRPLNIFTAPFGPIAWSRDGAKIVYQEQKKTVVLDVIHNKAKSIPVTAAGVTFGRDSDQLLLCSRSSNSVSGSIGAFSHGYGQKLELLDTTTGLRKTLVTFPLARIGLPIVSPDGKQIALVTNRDYPRTAPIGGHVYVCNADGSGLRQLTRGPEEISRIVWTDDGKSLLVVRRLSVGENGAVGRGGQYDLYHVDATNGETVNLTRSGRISSAWNAGDDVLLDVSTPLDATQNGLFRVPLKTLKALTAKIPEPPITNPVVQARTLADRLKGALGRDSWQTVVPTADLMKRLAKELADAVEKIYGKKMDFGPNSLNTLQNLCLNLPMRKGGDPILVLGCGAYYGETLRKSIGAEWRLQPVPFGQWRPQWKHLENPTVEIVLPFSHVFAHGADDFAMFMFGTSTVLNREDGRKTLLVYPPTSADTVFKQITPDEYRQAVKDLDKGNLFAAFAALQKLLTKQPKNQRLAETAINLCEQANLLDLADEMTEEVVTNGNTSPRLLLRFGDQLMKRDPKKAIQYYRKAVVNRSPRARAYLQLGKCYQQLGELATAESCWRVAFRLGLTHERQEALQLMRDARLFPAAATLPR